MFIALSKFLPLFVYPLGLACVLIVLALLLRKAGWQRLILALALLVLFAGGNHWIAYGLARSLEWRYLPPEEIPEAEAIVLLGGATLAKEPPRPLVEVNGAGDRLIYAAWLYKQGKADHLLLSGGRIDWLSSSASTPASEMADLLEIMGVPRDAMWLESKSRNTYENAVESRKILEPMGIRRIILVTSAIHMPRSVALFKRQGFQVIPAPADFTTTQADEPGLQGYRLLEDFFNLIPSAENLALTSRSLKEYFGIFVYRLRGWL